MQEYDTTGKRKPIEYKGFKSKLEFIAGKWLAEKLGLIALYENETCQTTVGKYTPDFYLPEIKTFVECKPTLLFADIERYKIFCSEQHKKLLILTSEEIALIDVIAWIESETLEKEIEVYYEADIDSIYFIDCSKCGKISFTSSYGIYSCSGCGFHDGMHDVRRGYVKKDWLKFYKENWRVGLNE